MLLTLAGMGDKGMTVSVLLSFKTLCFTDLFHKAFGTSAMCSGSNAVACDSSTYFH